MKTIRIQLIIISLLSILSIILGISILRISASPHTGKPDTDSAQEPGHDEETDSTMDDLSNSTWYDEVTFEKQHYDDPETGETCDYYLARIPLQDSEGRLIPVTQNYDPDLTPSEYAREHGTTLTINGNSPVRLSDGSYDYGLVISNGDVIHKLTNPFLEDIANGRMPDNYRYVCIMDDRTIQDFPVNTILNPNRFQYLGVQQCFIAYYKLVEDGAVIPYPEGAFPYIGTSNTGYLTPNPRMALGTDEDRNLYILCCDGRTGDNTGLTSRTVAELLNGLGCTQAWNLDGGGSASFTFHGEKQNRNIDNEGTSERKISRTLNVNRKPSPDN